MNQRYDRQRRLPEVGAEGQRRIEQAVVSLPEGDGMEYAVSYLSRAGVGQIRVGGPESAGVGGSFPHGRFFSQPVALELAHGAWQAVVAIRATLDKNG